jgi:Cu(I)/Ag(I) efflux system membrane fusion protein
MPGRLFDGRVSLIDPEIDPATRTLALRVELANADGALRPGLYGQVLLGDDTAVRRLAVPTSAVLDSGRRRVVFVELATGRYEPRAVVLGAQSDGYSEVREGLVAGEVVVVAANFLIDAESNLRSVLDSMAAPSAAADSTASPAAEQTHDHRGGH